MKKMKFSALFVLSFLAFLMVIGCASGPRLGAPTPLQQILNALPEINVAGNSLKFEFGGDTWIAKNSGRDFLAGSFTSEDTSEGSILTLNQTHIYSTEQKPGIGGDVGWVKTPGPQIVLEYKSGPPATMSTR